MFIVIEGTDGSGKGTQTERLTTWLEREGRDVLMTDFPDYESSSSYFVKEYLNGAYGGLEDVDGYQASLFFALDRYDVAKKRMLPHLDAGGTIVSNRYTTANMGHQAGKARSEAKRRAIIEWIEHVEYEVLGLPIPDVTIILFLDPLVGQRLVKQKTLRGYTNATHDLHEADIAHLRQAADSYLKTADERGWIIIDCLRGTFSERELLERPIDELVKSKDDIFAQIRRIVEGAFTSLLDQR